MLRIIVGILLHNHGQRDLEKQGCPTTRCRDALGEGAGQNLPVCKSMRIGVRVALRCARIIVTTDSAHIALTPSFCSVSKISNVVFSTVSGFNEMLSIPCSTRN